MTEQRYGRLAALAIGVALLVSGCSGALGLLGEAPSQEPADGMTSGLVGPDGTAISATSIGVLYDSRPAGLQTPSRAALHFGTHDGAFGDAITLAAADAQPDRVQITLGSWAAPSTPDAAVQTDAGTLPVRLTLYDASGDEPQTPGTEILRRTEPVAVPWHTPDATADVGSNGCAGPSGEGASQPQTQTASLSLCADATAFTTTFDLSEADVDLPKAIAYRVEIAPDSDPALAHQVGVGLVATGPNAPLPRVGADDDPSTIVTVGLPNASHNDASLLRHVRVDPPVSGALRITSAQP